MVVVVVAFVLVSILVVVGSCDSAVVVDFSGTAAGASENSSAVVASSGNPIDMFRGLSESSDALLKKESNESSLENLGSVNSNGSNSVVGVLSGESASVCVVVVGISVVVVVGSGVVTAACGNVLSVVV